eukprot:7699539-Prorocentrum_lima.AAC.1
MSQLSHQSAGRANHCAARRDACIDDKLDRLRKAADQDPNPEINVQLQYWTVLLDNIHKNAPIARAADWVGTLGGH